MPLEINRRVAPYLPFATFINSFDVLAQGVPPRLDRTLWRQSGLVQGQIMNAYRFFGLVNDDDSSNDWLVRMAKTPDQRPAVLKDLIEAQYYDVLDEHDLTKMTLKMLEDEFEKHFAVTGTTKQKAVTFFLKAAKFADMPLSTFLQAQLRNTGARKKRGPKQRGELQDGEITAPAAPQSQIPVGAISHSVKLVSGGTVAVIVSANPFSMPADDRAFVFSMIDKVQEYEKLHPGEETEEEE
jgi:hypothetical protein